MTLVRMRISAAALRGILRLPADVALAGAGTERLSTVPGEADILVLTVDMPAAPADAAEVTPVYSRDTSLPDPVTLNGFQWLRADGTATGQKTGLDRVAEAVRSARGGPLPAQIRGYA